MRIVVLGTGTGVGKTYVSRALVLACAAVQRAAGLKPIETGTDREQSDWEQLTRVSNPLPLGVAQPYRFEPALSPHLAAALAECRIELEAVVNWVEEVRSRFAYQTLVVETAGGVFTPLSNSEDNFDLASALGPARWVLVAPNRLGVLHETRAACLAMQARGRKPDIIVLCQAEAPDASSPSNAWELGRRSSVPIVELGFGAGFTELDAFAGRV